MVSTSTARYAGAVTTLAITLLAYDLSGSATAAGTLGTVRMLIAYGLAVFGGLVIDSYNRRTLMLIRATLSSLIWGTVGILLIAGAVSYGLFFALVCVATVVSGLLGHAGESALRSIVSKGDYVKARSINEGRDASAQVIGDPLSGFLYDIGTMIPFLVTSIGNLLPMLATWILPKLPPSSDEPADEAAPKESFSSRAWAGFRWIGKSKQMIALTTISAGINFANFLILSTVNLLLITSGIPPATIGLVMTCEAIAVIIGSALSTRYSQRFPTSTISFSVNLFSWAALIPLFFTQNIVVVGIRYFLYVLPIPINNAVIGGYRFQLVPTNMQGRVSAADTLLVGLPVAFTSMLAGAFVDAEIGPTGIGIGLLIGLAGLLPYVIERSLLTVPTPDHWPDTPPR